MLSGPYQAIWQTPPSQRTRGQPPTRRKAVAGVALKRALPVLRQACCGVAALLCWTCTQAVADAAPYSGKMNISCFVYRDINRNGTYDIADRPYSGLPFQLHRPDKGRRNGRSNISGFANFKMSLNNPEFPIDTPGQYQFIAQPPAGWQITSANRKQTTTIRELQGSPGGLVATKTLEPLGIAPVLFVRGTIEDETVAGLTAVSSTGERIPVKVRPDGAYIFKAGRGKWELELTLEDGDTRRRMVQVGDYPVLLSRWSTRADYVTATDDQGIDVVRFDDLTTSDTLYELPNGYAGLNWRNWISTHQKFYSGDGYINNTTSGEYLIYNSSVHPAEISSEQAFDFYGAYLGVAWPRAEQGDIYIKAWRGGDLAYEDSLRASRLGPIYFAAQYRGVTRIEFRTEKYWQVVLDDVRIAVPAPG